MAQIRERKELEEERREERAKEDEWEEKIRQCSPSQSWPITESWRRTDDDKGKNRRQHSNRKTYLYLKF